MAGRGVKGTRRGGGTIAALLFLTAPAPTPALAQTPAGTVIRNVATLGIGADTIRSNEVTLTVAPVIDVAVVALSPRAGIEDVPEQAVVFTVRNTGNATERYDLSASADVRVAKIAGDGVASSAVTLVAGETRTVLVTVADARLRETVAVALTATASRGHGAAGEGVIGPGGASATATTILSRAAAPPAGAGTRARLLKSETVRAPDGSARVMPGATITYRLEATFDAPAAAVAIDDRVPAGTTYVAGSLTIDGVAQSDATDADAAGFDGTAVHVALGDIAARGTRIVQFEVRIQ